jgi:excinuclease UvrABC ATPase subunit
MTIGELRGFAEKLRNNPPSGVEKIALELLGELNIKLEVLNSLGVSYLAVDRLGNSLSNGELQRIQLAKIIQTTQPECCMCLTSPPSDCIPGMWRF